MKGSMDVLDARREEVLELLGKGVPVEEVAKKFGVSRRTVFYWLKQNNISVKKIREEWKRKLEEKEKEKKERLATKGLIPEDFDEFMKLEEVKKFYEWLRARNVTTSEDIVRTLHKVCMKLNIHPNMLLEDEGKEKITSLLANAQYSKQTLESIKAHLRLWFKFNEKQPPAILALERYKSKIAHLAWFDEEERFKILVEAKNYKEFDLIRACLLFLFYTGSRSEALKNVRFEERRIKVNGKEVTAVIAITQEKGRHGKRQWEKPIKPEIYYKYIKGKLPISEKELKLVRRLLKKIYDKVIDKNSVKYEYAKKHPLHIWRHTAAMTLLHATDWNIGLVSEILGWDNPEILYQIYGRMPPEKKVAVVYGVEFKKPKFEYVSGEYLEKAYELGLL